MAPKAKAKPKAKPLVVGQQTLFAALKLPSSKKRSREDETSEAQESEASAGPQLRTHDSGARPSGEADSEQSQPALSRRSSSQCKQQPQVADVLLVLDFEATASQDNSIPVQVCCSPRACQQAVVLC